MAKRFGKAEKKWCLEFFNRRKNELGQEFLQCNVETELIAAFSSLEKIIELVTKGPIGNATRRKRKREEEDLENEDSDQSHKPTNISLLYTHGGCLTEDEESIMAGADRIVRENEEFLLIDILGTLELKSKYDEIHEERRSITAALSKHTLNPLCAKQAGQLRAFREKLSKIQSLQRRSVDEFSQAHTVPSNILQMAHCPVVNFGGNKKNEIDDGEGREKATPQHRSSTNNKHTGPRAARRDNAFVTKIEETVNLSAYA